MKLRASELEYQAAIRGWDQGRLARAAGVSEATVSRAFAGHAVRRSTVLRLAVALRDAPPIRELEAVIERSATQRRDCLPPTPSHTESSRPDSSVLFEASNVAQ